MIILKGYVIDGIRDFTKRMTQHRMAFNKVVGEHLQIGTINVKMPLKVKIREDYRLSGTEIGDFEQDFIFERCLINGKEGYRIRPLNLKTGGGGWGDDTFEIASSHWIANAKSGDEVEVRLFRDSV